MIATFCLFACAFLLPSAQGNAFLKADPKLEDERINEDDVQASLLAEVEGGLGRKGSKVTELKELIEPIFNALPKNEHGGLGHAVVRYALHRVFVQRHGWFISGLDRAGQSWNESSPTGILKDQVPDYVQNVFEKRLHGKGLGLQELALLAATIEHLVHNEALSKLGAAYSVHQRLPMIPLEIPEATEVLETYMMSYILGEALKNATLENIKKLKTKMPKIYLAWPETQAFIGEVRTNVSDGISQLDFGIVAKVAEKLGEQFGRFQDKECHSLKATLVKAEHRGTGRVRLADFYKPAYGGEDGSWQFQESKAYLRQLGALDESVPEDPSVIISNYLGSQANCIASSSFYGVCCRDECEDLLRHLENDIQGPAASPRRILSLVGRLSSSSVDAPRELSATLRKRLEEIAESHGGTVLLHGRLFAQWMHHAYPRECPFPHISGTTAPQAAFAWMESGQETQASSEEIQQVIDETKLARNASSAMLMEEDTSDLMPWMAEEEVLVERAFNERRIASIGPFDLPLDSAQNIVILAAVISAVLGMARNFMPSPKLGQGASQKYYV